MHSKDVISIHIHIISEKITPIRAKGGATEIRLEILRSEKIEVVTFRDELHEREAEDIYPQTINPKIFGIFTWREEYCSNIKIIDKWRTRGSLRWSWIVFYFYSIIRDSYGVSRFPGEQLKDVVFSGGFGVFVVVEKNFNLVGFFEVHVVRHFGRCCCLYGISRGM
jgi:hypothetical protein